MSKEADSAKKKRSPAAVILNVIGTLLIIFAVGLCLLLALPRLFGIYGFTVLTGSMEPTIPVGSLVYVKTDMAPEELQAGEIVVFYEGLGEIPVVHRLMENHVTEREIITKGDANAAEDLQPIPYQNIIGKDILHVPRLGALLTPLSTLRGKISVLAMVLAGLLLCIAAQRLRE